MDSTLSYDLAQHGNEGFVRRATLRRLALLCLKTLTILIAAEATARPAGQLRFTIEKSDDYDTVNVFFANKRIFSVTEVNFDNPVLIRGNDRKYDIFVMTSIMNHGTYFDEYSYSKFVVSNNVLISASNCVSHMKNRISITKPLKAAESQAINEATKLLFKGDGVGRIEHCKYISEISPGSAEY